MKHNDGYIDGLNGSRIYFQYWEPDTPAKAVIVLAHGAGEHCARYQHVAEYFTRYGYVMAGFDHAGHGKSDGARAHIPRFSDYVDMLELFRRQVAQDFAGLPLHLLGHSMGGLISACYLMRDSESFQSAVLSGPAIMTDLEPGALQLAIVRLLAMVLPGLGALQLDASGVSRDPEVVQRYRDDPLVHSGKMSARLVAELFAAMGQVQAGAGKITVPMLLLHGAKDSMTAPKGSEFLYEKISSETKDLKIYPELFHEILNEPEKELVLTDILSWLDGQSGEQ